MINLLKLIAFAIAIFASCLTQEQIHAQNDAEFRASTMNAYEWGEFAGEEAPLLALSSGIGTAAKTPKYLKRIENVAAKGVLKPLGLGSTGRTVPGNLTEQLAMKEILSNPSLSRPLKNMEPLNDPRWKGWIKMTNKSAHGVEIHFNAQIKNGKIINIDDFKFKDK